MKKNYLLPFLMVFTIMGSFAQKQQNPSDVVEKTVDDKGNTSAIIFSKDAAVSAQKPDVLFTDYLKVSKEDEMRKISSRSDKLGFTHDKYQQYHNGIKVEFATYTIHSKGGKVKSMMGQYYNAKNTSSSPSITSSSALAKATGHIGAKSYVWENEAQAKSLSYKKPQGELVIFPEMEGISNEARLAYKYDIYSHDPVYRADVYVDAKSGRVIFENARIHHADTPANGASLYNGNVSFTADNTGSTYRLRQTVQGIETYDLNNGTSYGAATDITSGSSTFSNEQTGVQAHYAAEQTHAYFQQNHNRDSYDGNGAVLRSYISYSSNYVNAFWDGSRMTYGDGDGVTYGPLVTLDITGHEIAHGVTQFSADLVYQRESGALNESFSDIFGEMVENHATGSNNWEMGSEIGISGNGAFRSMSNPKQYNDPDTYGGTHWTNPNCGVPTQSNDYCGVHSNSGVQNKWFYILAVGESGTNDLGNSYGVTGLGLTKAGAIAYRNLTTYLSANSTFANARTGAIQAAIDLYGAGSAEEIATTNAWYAVGVGAEYVPTCSLGAPANLSASNIGDNGFDLSWNAVSGAASYNLTIGGNTVVVNGTTYTASGLIEGTTYSVSINANCSSGGNGDSASINVTTTGTSPVTYCSSASTNINDEYIGRVQLAGIDNTSGGQFYTDFTAISTSLTKNASNTITVTPVWTGTVYNEGYSVWIDYNRDGDFTDSGEQVFTQGATSATSVSGSFSVPSTAVEGTTRMRVSMKYNGVPTSCETFTYGEVEDYTVSIAPSVADTEAPSVPTNLAASNVAQTTVDLSWNASNDNVGVTSYTVYQNGSAIATISGTSYQVTGLTADTTYSFTVSANDAAGNESAASSSISVTTLSNGGGGSDVLLQSFFETGWDGWIDGGGDSFRYSGSRSYEGNYSIRLRDNTNSSTMTTGAYNVSAYNTIEIEFFFYPNSMENGEDFWVQFYDGSSWNIVAAYASGTSFSNGSFYTATVTISSADYNFASNSQFRFRCDASANADQVYIDQVTITGNAGSGVSRQAIADLGAPGGVMGILGGETDSADFESDFLILPNPVKNSLQLRLAEANEEATYRIVNMLGQVVRKGKINANSIDVTKLSTGIYIMEVNDGDEVMAQQFIKE